MKPFLQTAFILLVLLLLPFSVALAQDPVEENNGDDDGTMAEPTDETTEDTPPKAKTFKNQIIGSLYEFLVQFSDEKKIDMIITPDTAKVDINVFIYKEIEKDALNMSEEGGSKVMDFDILLSMVLETYGYYSEIRNGVYIIRPITDAKGKADEQEIISRSFDVPKYFRFSEIEEQFKSFIGEKHKIISNLNSRVIFVMSTQEAINKIDEYFRIIDEKADKEPDYSIEELMGIKKDMTKAKASANEEEEVEKIEIRRQIYRFANSMEQVLVDLRNLLPLPVDADYEPWTIINEDEKLVLITGPDSDHKMVEEYIRQMKLNLPEVEIPLAEQIDTRVYTLGRPVEEVSKDIEPFLTPEGVIVSNPEKNFIIIKDKLTNFILLERFIQELDVEPQQVYIEATFMELKLDHDFRFGIDSDWNKSLGLLDWSWGTPGGTTGYLLGVMEGTEWAMKMNAMSTNTDSNILSRPRVLIKNGKLARIVVGQEVPYLTTDDSTAGNVTQDVEFKDISITMNVTPHVEPGDRVRMIIKISIKEQIGTVTLAGSETPITSNRELDTEVFVNSGDTLIMGGLYENKTTDTVTALPVVGELPIIGMLFSTTVETTKKTDLLFFITPTIVKDTDEQVDIVRNGRTLKFRKDTKPVRPSWQTDQLIRRLSK